MSKVLVSIIVPIYQAEKFLMKSVETVLNQTLKDIEIILVNDGSTDKSGAICDDIASKDHRVKVIHKKNEGQSAARNTGIEAATGKYIGFMDHDDFLYPEMCERLYRNAEKYMVDISAGSYITRNEVGEIRHDQHTGNLYLYNSKEGTAAFLSGEVTDIYVWTKLYRKDFLDEHHICFEAGRNEEDFLFNHCAFMHAQKTVMDDTPIYLYIEYTHSTCRTYHIKKFQKYIDDMCYRIFKIENETHERYPDLTGLAQRQTIKACVKMLSVMSTHKRNECEPYYSRIKKYFRKNASIVIKERKYWGMSKLGVWLAAYVPTTPYFYLKKWKNWILKV